MQILAANFLMEFYILPVALIDQSMANLMPLSYTIHHPAATQTQTYYNNAQIIPIRIGLKGIL